MATTRRTTGRRGNGEGGITKLTDGRWQARFTNLDGKRKAVYGTTRAEASKKLTAALSARDKGKPRPAEQETAGAYLASWLAMKKHGLRSTTFRRYGNYVNHLTPVIGKVRLARLTPEDVEGAYDALRAKGLSETTIRHCHEMLSGALKHALGKEKVVRNAAALATNRPVPVQKEITPLTDAQVGIFLRAVAGLPLEALYTVAVTTGARQGELLSFRWSDIDLDAGSIYIQRTLEHEGGTTFTFAPPKTEKSRRHIKLTPLAVRALRHHHAVQAEARLAAGSSWGAGVDEYRDLVFTDDAGGPIDGRHRLTRDFAALLAREKLPEIRFHDLRHTCATMLLRKGVHPKIVSELLGHASVAITMDVYSHYIPTMQDAAVEAMTSVVGG